MKIDIRALELPKDARYVRTLLGDGLNHVYTTKSREEIDRHVREVLSWKEPHGKVPHGEVYVAEWAGKVVAVCWVGFAPQRSKSHSRPSAVIFALGIRESHWGDHHLIVRIVDDVREHFLSVNFGSDHHSHN